MGEASTIRDLGVVSQLNVTEIITCSPLELAGLELIGRSGVFYVYRNRGAMGRAMPICPNSDGRLAFGVEGCDDEARIDVIAADTPTGFLQLRVALPSPRVVVLSEPYYPERRAWVDGSEAPVEKVSLALSAIRLDAGAHLVEMRFVPTTLYWGIAISIGVILSWMSIRFFGRP
jgi:hypothetical protein